MSLTLEDIDYDQYYGVKTNTGSINDIQVLNDSPLYYLNNAGYRWFHYPETELQSPSDPLYYARYELNNTNSFFGGSLLGNKVQENKGFNLNNNTRNRGKKLVLRNQI